MMKYLTFLSMLLACTIVRAQNIVPNPGFSAHTYCPNGVGHLSYCTGWYQVTQGTPDYFDTCATLPLNTDIPGNYFGYQPTSSGSYTGLYGSQVTPLEDYKEYMGTNIPPLEVGAFYRVTMLVSHAGKDYCPSAGLGAYFYISAKPDTTIRTPILYRPQIDYNSYGVIADTVNWVTLTKVFKADSAYTHLVIGNFRVKDSLQTGPVCNSWKTSYYYIDSVSVEKTIPNELEHADVPLRTAVYPNPFIDRGTLTFSNPSGIAYRVSIFNAEGKIVSTIEEVKNNKISIDGSQLPTGMYYYKLSSDMGETTFGKFLITR